MIQTTTLDNGLVVLAKKDGTPLTYGNRAQAAAKILALPPDESFRVGVEPAPGNRFYVTFTEKPFREPYYLESEEFGEEEYAQLAALELAETTQQIGREAAQEFSEVINEVVGDDLNLIEQHLADYIRSVRTALLPSRARDAAEKEARRDRLNREARRILDRMPPFLPHYIKHVPRTDRAGGAYLGFDRCSAIPHLEVPLRDIKTLTESGVLTYRRKRKQYRFDEAKVREVIGT